MGDRYRLYGSVGSPYALKLKSLLRYRRIPFDWVPASLDWVPEGLPRDPASKTAREEIGHVRPPVMPVLWFPQDGTFMNDSTPVAYALEDRHAERSAVPADPALAFLSHLLEDMADEWAVKIAFHYRWGHEEDALFKSRIVAAELLGGGFDEDTQRAAGLHFARRQQGRMPLVGCTPRNAPLIEEVYRRVLDVMQALPERSLFFFGSRPALTDFGWYGELVSLATDPTPAAIIVERAPATLQWLQALDDASGIEGEWMTVGDVAASPVCGLIELAAQVYLPFLAANTAALEAGAADFSCESLGLPYSQDTFKYQAKCWRVIRERYAALSGTARDAVDGLLTSEGVRLLAASDG